MTPGPLERTFGPSFGKKNKISNNAEFLVNQYTCKRSLYTVVRSKILVFKSVEKGYKTLI